VLGFLNREALCGGTVPIDEKRAHASIQEKIAKPLGRTLMETPTASTSRQRQA